MITEHVKTSYCFIAVTVKNIILINHKKILKGILQYL